MPFIAKAKDSDVAGKDQWISFGEEDMNTFKERIAKEEDIDNFEFAPL